MKPSSKDRIKLSVILIGFLLALSAFGYMIFGKHKTAGEYTSARIVKAENIQEIELNKKYHEFYAIKVQENDKFYLKYYRYDENNVPYESKYELTSDQYSKLVENNQYWFNIKYSKLDDNTKGIIAGIYTDNPVQK